MANPKFNSHKNPEYEKFVRSHPCLICQNPNVDLHHAFHAKRNSFMVTPLCREHHSLCHSMGHTTFQDKLGIDFHYEIINFLAKYIEDQEENHDLAIRATKKLGW